MARLHLVPQTQWCLQAVISQLHHTELHRAQGHSDGLKGHVQPQVLIYNASF